MCIYWKIIHNSDLDSCTCRPSSYQKKEKFEKLDVIMCQRNSGSIGRVKGSKLTLFSWSLNTNPNGFEISKKIQWQFSQVDMETEFAETTMSVPNSWL